MDKFQALKGMRDILPGEVELWQDIEEKARYFFEASGFEEIRTPLLEPTELFARSIGEGSDIVHKQMYTFEDRGGRSIFGSAQAAHRNLSHDFLGPIRKPVLGESGQRWPRRNCIHGNAMRAERSGEGLRRATLDRLTRPGYDPPSFDGTPRAALRRPPPAETRRGAPTLVKPISVVEKTTGQCGQFLKIGLAAAAGSMLSGCSPAPAERTAGAGVGPAVLRGPSVDGGRERGLHVRRVVRTIHRVVRPVTTAHCEGHEQDREHRRGTATRERATHRIPPLSDVVSIPPGGLCAFFPYSTPRNR